MTCYVKKIINTEKTSSMSTSVVCLLVNKDCSKSEIEKTFTSIFPSSKVKKIGTLNEKASFKNFKGRRGVVSGYKKAYVTLSTGPIDVNNLNLD